MEHQQEKNQKLLNKERKEIKKLLQYPIKRSFENFMVIYNI